MPFVSSKKLRAYEDLKDTALEIYKQARFSGWTYRKCKHGMKAHRVWYCDACFFGLAGALQRLGVSENQLESGGAN